MSIFMSWVQVKELLYIYTLHRLRIIFSGRFILFLLQQTHHVDQTPRPKGSDSCVCKNSPKAYTFFFSFLFLRLEIGFINHSEYYYCFVKEMRKKKKSKKEKEITAIDYSCSLSKFSLSWTWTNDHACFSHFAPFVLETFEYELLPSLKNCQ
jgi:hypothetical protein